MIYLDWAATSLPDPDAVDAALSSIKNHYGNPSSVHTVGTDAAAVISECRQRIASVLKCSREKLIFCSSGTEANNIIISSLIQTQSPGSVLVSPVEHAAVYKPVHRLKQAGWRIIDSKVKNDGIVDAQQFLSQIEEDTHAVFLMHVCNENGAIQPVEAVAAGIKELNRSRKRKIRLHIDMVQALGKVEIDLGKLAPDSASFSGHKIGAVRGSGMLFLNRPLIPVYEGGGQERGMRSGTENTAAIESLATAVVKSVKNLEANREKALLFKRRILDSLIEYRLPLLPSADIEQLMNPQQFSPWIIQTAIEPLPSEVLVRIFDDNRISISGGSACSANSREKAARISNVLGFPARTAESVIRISTGPQTTDEEIETFLSVLKEAVLPLAKKF